MMWLWIVALLLALMMLVLMLAVYDHLRAERQRTRALLEEYRGAVNTSLTLMEQRIDERLAQLGNGKRHRSMHG